MTCGSVRFILSNGLRNCKDKSGCVVLELPLEDGFHLMSLLKPSLSLLFPKLVNIAPDAKACVGSYDCESYQILPNQPQTFRRRFCPSHNLRPPQPHQQTTFAAIFQLAPYQYLLSKAEPWELSRPAYVRSGVVAGLEE